MRYLLLLIFLGAILMGCDDVPEALSCVSSTPTGWATWEQDNGKTVCWKSKGFQCAPKCGEN